MKRQEKDLELLKPLLPVEYKRLLYGEWLPEKGIEDVSSEDIYRVMKRTGMTYQEVMSMTYAQFEVVKGQS